ncbi:Not1-domain-containing protein [Yamadazyma tenuis ATCC 10573]|uniref:Not1-domain-containing protein n=1 Tax=Candida tenuis (strain ATCC 10573 / BCRC 21748 / CBS 615 / JCM 9827 / NBRC 10315 / NRRL Y-1498 / VKM Y-70) TaxID=590646 RepID=G3AZI2_CANTC|nr:Not1-domain-containing protein [Yamadazyma tenuis ATCC 10573]EGV65584.1 Not1-domain-containing protein [Yamadazyma tenuis ATCC 10573]
MSFKELLIEVNKDLKGINPGNLLPVMLKIDKKEIDSSLALVIAEVISPGSTNLPSNPLKGLSTCKSFPESSAKGAQLQTTFKLLDSDPAIKIDWLLVFSKAQETLSASKAVAPSFLNINQFIAAIDFRPGLLDIALSVDWSFSNVLLYTLLTADPKQGCYDLGTSPFLTRGFDDVETPIESQLGRRTPIAYINVGRLELKVVSQYAASKKPLNEKSIDSEISKLFDHHCHTFPEYMLCACITFVNEGNPFIEGVLNNLLDTLLTNESKFLRNVIQKFNEREQGALMNKLFNYYNLRKNTDAILTISRAMLQSNLFDSLLTQFLNINITMGLNLAICSSVLDFDCKPLIDSLLNDPNKRPIVVQAILEILEVKSTEDTNLITKTKVLGVATVFHLLGILTRHAGFLNGEKLKALQLQLLTTYPRLINFGCGHDGAILENDKVSNVFPEPVEQEMKAYYSKMYNKELDIKEIVDMLIKFKSSDIPHDQDIFACMIHSLLDEYRFFSEYPLTALASTSLLFGALLQKDIIQGTTLTVALNFIWESCNQPQDSHLFKFAVQALYNFKSRLHEYPNYCKHLLECNSLSAHAKMYQIVKDASNGIPCDDQSFNGSRPDSSNSSGQPMSINKSTEDGGIKYQSITISDQIIGSIQQEKPNENVTDRLLFFVNNLTGDNLNSKLPEIKDYLIENFFLWFADYLVADRAKSEPNNHRLYCELVQEFDDPIFYEYVLSVSLREVSFLIRNFKDTSLERSHLKNLGSWLGQITLASDKALKRTHIGVKFLLVEAYDFKTLPYVIPFVCKILDQAKYSKIFNLPNPWVLGIIKVLVELYDCADLKLNSKFEIEVLLNSFNMKISDVEPSTIVRSHPPNPAALAAMFGIQQNANPLVNDFSKLALDGQAHLPPAQFQPSQMSQHQGSEDGGIPSLSGQIPPQGLPQPKPQGQPKPTAGGLDTSFSTLVGNTIFTTNPNLRRAFQASLSRAVRECAVPILSKTSESVITTTEALIKKDFAYEGDINKFRKSYQSLAVKLAQSIIGSSGRKILIETIQAFMVRLLSHQLNPNDIPLGELSSAIQSNVDLCVDIVNKLAVGNIIELIEEKMKYSVLEREQNQPGQRFVEKDANGYALNLQPPLGLKPEGLLPSQLAVYENFSASIVRPEVVSQPQAPPQPQGLQSLGQPQAPPTSALLHPPQQQQPGAPGLPVPQDDTTAITDQLFAAITQSCDKAISSLADNYTTTLAEIPQDHVIMQCITNVLTLAQGNALKYPELLLKVAQYAVNCLFTQAHENPISNEIYVVILDKLCEYSPSTAKDVTWWLVHSSDQRKLNISVMYSLLKVQLIQPTKLDTSISKLITETKNPLIVTFAANLLGIIYTSKDPRPIALRSEFALSLASLSKYEGDQSIEGTKEAREARDKLFELLNDNALVTANSEMYSQLGYIFTEWFKLLTHGDCNEELKDEFVKGLFKTEILTDPELFSMFFKSAIEVSITSFAMEHDIRSRTQHEALLVVDALAALIVHILIKFDKNNVEDAVEYFKNIMGVILVSFTNDHESSNGQWSERAYFKFFSSLLCYWNDASMMQVDATVHMDIQFFNFVGDIFYSLQPIIFPGFTFAWISLISHRMFLPRVLELPNKTGHGILVKLLTPLLRFESIYSVDESVNYDVICVIFKAINRIFVGLFHDYPDFFSENYLQLLACIPASYIQLRNIVLSATPKGITLENPFKRGLKVERISDMKKAPIIFLDPTEDIVKSGLRRPVDNYLRIPGPGLIKAVYNGLKLSKPKQVKEFEFDSVNYNVGLINSLVLYVTLSEGQENGGAFQPKDAHVSIFFDLLSIGSTEFKFHLINALANQLRYPNTHTNWSVGLFLHFFNAKTWSNSESRITVQELITRVLLERHVVNKPHQWGLTILLTELIKNDTYNFFELPFVKNSPPEIKLVFDSLYTNITTTP